MSEFPSPNKGLVNVSMVVLGYLDIQEFSLKLKFHKDNLELCCMVIGHILSPDELMFVSVTVCRPWEEDTRRRLEKGELCLCIGDKGNQRK